MIYIYEDRRTYEKFSLRTCEDMRVYIWTNADILKDKRITSGD